MKIFWSWQSDHDGKISRHFVRTALVNAIEQLNEDTDVDDADRQEIELDHDRKDVPGSPDLARLILEKIENCDVFVGDVTPVGELKTGKLLINSNVAIELGYALRAIGDRRIIMVMNEHFGGLQDLPFDLRHKAGPIVYRLAPRADKAEIASAKKQLTAKLKIALDEMNKFHSQAKARRQPFQRIATVAGDPSRFLECEKALVTRELSFKEGPQNFFLPRTPLIYLRVIPTVACSPIKRPQAVENASEKLPDFSRHYRTGGAAWPNEFGAVILDADYNVGSVNCATQLFLSREIWAINSELLAQESRSLVPMRAVASLFARKLTPILAFIDQKLEVKPPWRIEAGAYPVNGYELALEGNNYGRRWPIIQQKHVCWSGLMHSARLRTY